MVSKASQKHSSFTLRRKEEQVVVASVNNDDPRSSRRLTEVLQFLARIPQGRGALAVLERARATLVVVDPSGPERLEASRGPGGDLVVSMSGMSADWLAANVVGECARLRDQELGVGAPQVLVAGVVAT